MITKMKNFMMFVLIAIAMTLASNVSAQTFTVHATKYHPGMGGAGWRTASGDRIDNTRLKNYEIRWVALSPDLFKSGFRMGDTILVESDNVPKLNGKWVVKDRMGSRTRMKIDFLLPKGDNYGFYNPHKVKITKQKN